MKELALHDGVRRRRRLATSRPSEDAARLAWLERWRSLVWTLRRYLSAPADGHGWCAGSAEALSQQLAEARSLRMCLAMERPGTAADAVQLGELLVEATEIEADLRDATVARRAAALTGIHEALASGNQHASPEELLQAAPGVLCETCDLDWAILSRVSGSGWVPQAIHHSQNPDLCDAFAGSVTGVPRPLSASTPESEIIRRRAPALVPQAPAGAESIGPLENALRGAHVAAPIICGRSTVGLLHAGNHSSRRQLGPADRENLFAFAQEFAVVYQRAVLRRRMESQRTRAQETFSAAIVRLETLADESTPLRESEHQSTISAPTAGRAFAGRITTLLTAREREVLALVTEGNSNRDIARQLMIAEATVKSHLKHLLRKLGLANRAQAVALGIELQRGADAN
jgi:LuxR family transcriptional regulator, regulator of acetate metabolism